MAILRSMWPAVVRQPETAKTPEQAVDRRVVPVGAAAADRHPDPEGGGCVGINE